MKLQQIKEKLKLELTTKRYIHSINVMNSSIMLAEKYGEDVCKAELAGLLHDCARDIRGEKVFELCEEYKIEVDDISMEQPELLHGPIGSRLAEKIYAVTDLDVISAIYNHTLGRENMRQLEKIVFIADYIEPGREFPGVDNIREMAVISLDNAMLLAFDCTFAYCLKKNCLIHPKAIYARNYILNNINIL